MDIPKYIIEILERANISYSKYYAKNPEFAIGYTIEVHKRTEYVWISSLKSDIEKLEKFIIKNSGEMKILNIPNETHHSDQYAVITIYDPLMRHLEEFIKG